MGRGTPDGFPSPPHPEGPFPAGSALSSFPSAFVRPTWAVGALGGDPGGRARGESGPQTACGGGGWKALRVPSKFVTKCGDSSGFERLPKVGEAVRERVSRIVHWIS